MSGPPGPGPLLENVQPTPSFDLLLGIANLNADISTLSSYVQSLGPSGGPTIDQFQALSNEYSTMSTNISSVGGVYSTNLDNYNSLSSYYTILSSGLNLVAKVDYLSSVTPLYLGASTYASSLTINKSLNVGTNTIGATTLFNAAIGLTNTMNSSFGLTVGQLHNVTGANSVALNYQTTVSGQYSHAEGSFSEVTNSYSHAEGERNSNYGPQNHTEGQRNSITAGCVNAHAEGWGQQLAASDFTADSQHAEGLSNQVNGNYAHSEGTFSQVYGTASHAEGFGSIVIGENAHAEGWSTFISDQASNSHAEGYSTFISIASSNSHAEGQLGQIYAPSAHTEGFQTIVTGAYGHAEGWNTIASTIASHAEGRAAEADGDYSHAEGISTMTGGIVGHVEGASNRVVFDGSHVEGIFNSSIGTYCHVEGRSNIVSTSAAHVHGSLVRATNIAAHAHGSGFSGSVALIASGIASHSHGRQDITMSSNANAVGNYSHTHGCNVGAPGLAATAIGMGTYLLASGNYSFGCGQFNTLLGSNVLVSGSYNIQQNAGYNYQSYLGGACNNTIGAGSVGISSGVVLFSTIFSGVGATTLGGFANFPRNNWALVNSCGILPNLFRGVFQTEWFNLYATTSTTDTYCNLVYLSNKADQTNTTSSNLCAYNENSRTFMNTFEVQLMGYERENVSSVAGAGIYSANYRFNCYWDNVSTNTAGSKFRTWRLCDSDGTTIGVNSTKDLTPIITLNKLSGTPTTTLQAYISSTVFAAFNNSQSITALSIKTNTNIPVNWYAQVRQGITYWNIATNIQPFPWT